jgi:MFS family permease
MQNVAAGRLQGLIAAPQRAAATTISPRGTIITVGLGEILIQLGLTPLTAVVPSVSAALGVSALDGAWLITVYILALAGTLLVSGRLGDLLGHRKVFGVGALVFSGATALAGLAPTFELLLAARIGQGVGGAMISGNNLAILSRAIPTEERARAIAIVATASSFAAVVGSALGAVAVQLGLWPLLFLGPLPLALLAAFRARGLPGGERVGASVDWLGAGLLVVTMTLLAFALNHPHTTTTDVLFERRVRVPLLDWRQLRNAQFGAAVGVNGILHLTMMAAMFLGPLLVVQGLGLSIIAGGALMVVVQGSITATAYLGGWLYDRTRSVWLRPAGSALLMLGMVAWALAGWQESYVGLILAGLVAGLGSGVLLAVNNTVIMSALPADSRGVASGMLETTRHFGHAFGVTIPTAILAIVLAGFGGEMTTEAIRWGFSLGCLAMAGLAAGAVGLGLWQRA